MALLSLAVAAGSLTMLRRDGRWTALKFGAETQVLIALLIGGDRHLRCAEDQWPTWRDL